MLLTQVKDDREVVTLCPQLLHFPFKNWWSHQHLFGISYLPIVHLPFIITCTSSSNPMWWALWLFPFDRWGRLCLDRFSDEFWRRQWHPTLVLLPAKYHGRRSLVGCSPWGREESDTTEWLPFTFHFHALEKKMATHSSVLAWRIPGTGEPGGLPSVGSHRVGHDWSGLAVAAGS